MLFVLLPRDVLFIICKIIIWSLTYSYIFFERSNLYKSQKLLSLSIEVPMWHMGPPLKGGAAGQAEGLSGEFWGWRGEGTGIGEYDEESLSSVPALVLMLLSCIVVFLAYRYYRQRTRPRRKRPPRLRRIMAVLNAGRVPAVWKNVVKQCLPNWYIVYCCCQTITLFIHHTSLSCTIIKQFADGAWENTNVINHSGVCIVIYHTIN